MLFVVDTFIYYGSIIFIIYLKSIQFYRWLIGFMYV